MRGRPSPIQERIARDATDGPAFIAKPSKQPLQQQSRRPLSRTQASTSGEGDALVRLEIEGQAPAIP